MRAINDHESTTLSADKPGTRIVFRNRGPEAVGEQLYSAGKPDCAGYPHWHELPERCREHWIEKAKDILSHYAQFLVSEPI